MNPPQRKSNSLPPPASTHGRAEPSGTGSSGTRGRRGTGSSRGERSETKRRAGGGRGISRVATGTPTRRYDTSGAAPPGRGVTPRRQTRPELVPDTLQVPTGGSSSRSPDRQRHQTPAELIPGVVVQVEQIDQRLRIPVQIGARGERARPRGERHCDRPTTLRPRWNTSPGPRPAKHTSSPNAPGTARPVCVSRPCSPRRARASVHHAPTHSAATETSSAHSGSSLGIHASIQSWPAGSRYTAPPPPRRRARFTERSPQRLGIHQLRPLRAAEHQRRLLHLAGDGHAPRFGAELLDVEERLRRGQPQEAAARYGSHKGSTSDRWRSRHRWPSGGAGFTRSVQPSSESNWSAFSRLSRLQAATTLDQSWVPPRLPRDHMVDRVGRLRAVDAESTIAAEDGPPGDRRCAGPAGDSHHVGQPHDRRHLYLEPGRVEHLAVLADRHRLGPSRKHQNDGTAIRDEGERLVGRVEEEHPLHTQERLPAAGARPLTPPEVGHDVGRGSVPRPPPHRRRR